MEKLYNLELTIEEIMFIGNTLAELPYKNTVQLLNKISEQVGAQEKVEQESSKIHSSNEVL